MHLGKISGVHVCLSIRRSNKTRDAAARLNNFDFCDDRDVEMSGLPEAETSQKISLTLSSLSVAKASNTHMSPH